MACNEGGPHLLSLCEHGQLTMNSIPYSRAVFIPSSGGSFTEWQLPLSSFPFSLKGIGRAGWYGMGPPECVAGLILHPPTLQPDRPWPPEKALNGVRGGESEQGFGVWAARPH